ncbi:MAG: SET domain-containing protein [Myxococcales bacterium]
MIHPSTELRYVDDVVGFGVFASAPLPKGTITYVWDPLEIEVLPDDPRLQDPNLAAIIERYSYIDPQGVRIVSWDHAKYVNHCCQANTMSTAYGFEIAVRDIEAGEQITDEYGMFNLPEPMDLCCSTGPCRGKVQAGDLERYYERWDSQIQSALARVEHVDQPLWPLVDVVTATAVEHFARWGRGYRSVRELEAFSDACARGSGVALSQ